MEVLKITAFGLTTSFRYPHFMMGVQPTYEMPPPATLYGHIASALGGWFDPSGVRFAVRFSFTRKQADVETTHLLKRATGKMPHHKTLPKVLEGKSNPFQREILFFPQLTLYLNRPEWAEAFRHPRFAVCLGRSQDLFTYQRVEVVTLHRTDQAYLEHILLPHTYARRTAAGQTVLMPRYLDYANRRFPTFERYVILHRRIHLRECYTFLGDPPLEVWADPTEPAVAGDPLGVVFLAWEDA